MGGGGNGKRGVWRILGGSHGFPRERWGDQSSPTEYKGVSKGNWRAPLCVTRPKPPALFQCDPTQTSRAFSCDPTQASRTFSVWPDSNLPRFFNVTRPKPPTLFHSANPTSIRFVDYFTPIYQLDALSKVKNRVNHTYKNSWDNYELLSLITYQLTVPPETFVVETIGSEQRKIMWNTLYLSSIKKTSTATKNI